MKKNKEPENTMRDVIEHLYQVICGRKNHPATESYTARLFQKGPDKILKKIGEETTEVVLAAKNNDRENLIHECADLTYHVLVLLARQGIAPEEVGRELKKRSKQ